MQIAVLSVAIVGGFSVPRLPAQEPATPQPATSVAGGVYTPAQARRGQSLYLNACSHCHLYDLSGGRDPDGVGDSPPLAGPRFLRDWDGETVGALFNEIRTAMPFDNPGTLSARECADVVAFILSVNQFPPGDHELAHDAAPLRQIRMAQQTP